MLFFQYMWQSFFKESDWREIFETNTDFKEENSQITAILANTVTELKIDLFYVDFKQL